MKNIAKVIGSIKLSLVLFFLFAFFSGVATFIESKYGTPTAWQLVYASFYFGFIQLFLGINLLFAIFRYKMYKKTPLLLFHVSFLFILFGSIMTRYFGEEGSLHIREGSDNDTIITSQSYISLSNNTSKVYKQVYLSLLGFNDLNLQLQTKNGLAKLTHKGIILHAKKDYIKGENGKHIIRFLANQSNKDIDFIISKDEYKILDDVVLSFDKELKIPAKTLTIDKDYNLYSNFTLSYLDVLENQKKVLNPNQKINLQKSNVILHLNNYDLRAYDFIENVVEIYNQSDDERLKNVLVFELDYHNKQKTIYIAEDEQNKIEFDDMIFDIAFGSLSKQLPFSVYLDKFELERYISSNSAKSYKSYVTINDNNQQIKKEIYMNNTLDYGGFRFFQSSYDTDEKGTILSVNKDPGKFPTYIGYFLLTLGLIFNLFDKNSRFLYLAKKLSSNSLVLLMFMCFGMFNHAYANAYDDIKEIFNDYQPVEYKNISKDEHFKHLSRLLIQTPTSRIAPFDTLAKDVVEKIHHKTTYQNLNHNEIFMQIIINFDEFKNKDFIYVNNDTIKEKFGLSGKKYAKLVDFFDEKTNEYKLKKEVDKASRKSPNKRSVYEKELLKVDERVNIFMMVSYGYYFTAFGYDESAKWLSIADITNNTNKDLNTQIYVLGTNYFQNLIKSYKSNDFSLANSAIDLISYYQYKNIKHKIPNAKISLEIFLNNAKIFTHLMQVYIIVGLVLVCFVFARLIKPGLNINLASKTMSIILVLAFTVHTIGLLLRWYVSNHAPWSNSYESMIYISWAITLSGIVFAKKSHIALSLSVILSGIMLFGAVLAGFDPQITDLVPVLQSYWLSIHVSVITASYGFFGLCALLGFFVLLLMSMPKKYHTNIKKSIKEATYINEMSMILGLSLLVIGNFFGAIWANESWGRYWGWDSKETWALVSILVYSFIVHARLVKFFANTYIFAVLSMFAYWSILMTYFGVNYFLTGMHSYAKGEASAIPMWVYIVFAIMVVLSIMASKNKKLQERL